MYRTIETSTWSDPAFDGLKSSAKLLFLYFITNEHTHVSGIYHCRRLWILNETGLPEDAILKSLDTLSAVGMCYFDPKTEVIWVKNMLKHQGKSSKLKTAARKHLRTLHNSNLINDFRKHYPDVENPPKKGRKRKNADRVSAVALKEQEQEQDIKEFGDMSDAEKIEVIYQTYPRKAAKPVAIDQISRALTRIRHSGDADPAGFLLDRTQSYAEVVEQASRAGIDVGVKTPHPSTWYRQDRFNDGEQEWHNALKAGVSNGRPHQLRLVGAEPDHRAAKREREYPEPERELPDLIALTSAAVGG